MSLKFCLAMCLLWSTAEVVEPAAHAPRITRSELDNGLKVSLITIHEEPVFTAFTFIPGGLVTDEPERFLWSRLIERLSTQLQPQSDGKACADHLRLESWSWPEQWEGTLREHAAMLKGTELHEQALQIFREDALYAYWWSEDGIGTRHILPAVFAQAVRYGSNNVEFKQAIEEASLCDVAEYREKRWGVLPGTRLCVISGIAPELVEEKVADLFGEIPANRHAQALSRELSLASRTITWESDYGVVLLTWHLPSLSIEERAALFLAGSLLERHWQKEWDEPVLDQGFGQSRRWLSSFPEGDFFFLSRELSSRQDSDATRRAGLEIIALLFDESEPYVWLDEVRRYTCEHLLLEELPRAMNPRNHKIASPLLFERWLEYRRGWAEIEWRYGPERIELGRAARDLTAERIRQIARMYLSERDCITFTMVPRSLGPP